MTMRDAVVVTGTGVVSVRSFTTSALLGRAMRIGIGRRPPPRCE